MSEQRKLLAQNYSGTPVMGSSSPASPAPWETPRGSTSRCGGAAGGDDSTGCGATAPNCSLSDFQRKYTSEDNVSFSEILEKDQEKHRTKYAWAFEKDTKILLLANGTKMSEEQRLLMDTACATEKSAPLHNSHLCSRLIVLHVLQRLATIGTPTSTR